MSDPKRDVTAGAALLDKHHPDWFGHVNFERLKMLSCSDCILGQLYGDYDEGKKVLGLVTGGEYGFNPSLIYKEITKKHWIEEAKTRQAA